MQASKEYDLNASGDIQYQYASVWSELAATGRTAVEPKPNCLPDGDKLRYQSVLFTEPFDARGTVFLNSGPSA